MSNPYVLTPWRAFANLSPFWKIATGAALLIVCLMAGNGAAKAVEAVRAYRLDSRLAEKDKQIGELQIQRQELIERAANAEARALYAESLEAAKTQIIEQKGGQIAQEGKRLENELNTIRANAGECGAIPDPVQRNSCLCSKLKRNGFPCS